MSDTLVLAASVALVAIAQLNYKLYAEHMVTKRLVIAILCFATSQIGFFVALTTIDIGLVYMSTAVTQVLVLLFSYTILKEAVNRHHLIAIVLIGAGLALYAM